MLSEGKKTLCYSERPDCVSDFSEECLELLREYSGKSLVALKEAGVVVFSEDKSVVNARNTDLNSDKSLLFYKLEKEENGFRIDTGNLMGVLYLRKDDVAIKICVHSRFDSGNPKQFFLNYLLAKARGLSFTEPVNSSDDAALDILLAHGFLQGLANASVAVGLYKQYRNFHCNDLNFKGRLDLDRHIKQNCPLWDKIAYTKREISFDNPINHLLRSTLKKISEQWDGLEDNYSACREIIHFIKQNTPSWNASDTAGLLAHRDCRERIRHPLFLDYYEPLRKLARLILEGESLNVYGSENDTEISGVVFDGAWLWEEYIATLLTPVGFLHAQRSSRESGTEGIHVFEKDDGKEYKVLYPDFRKLKKGARRQECDIIFDTKYKRGASENRSDLHQVFCYMFLTGAKIGGLIYPPRIEGEDDKNKDPSEDDGNENRQDENKVQVLGKTVINKTLWRRLRFPSIRERADWEKFCNAMRDAENDFENKVEKIEEELSRFETNCE